MLSKNKLKAIEFLNQGYSIENTANEIGINKRTLYRWKKEDSFKQCLDEKQEEIREEIRRKFLDTAYKARLELEKMIKDKNSMARIQAIKEVFAQAGFTPENTTNFNLNSDKIIIRDTIQRTDKYDD